MPKNNNKYPKTIYKCIMFYLLKKKKRNIKADRLKYIKISGYNSLLLIIKIADDYQNYRNENV